MYLQMFNLKILKMKTNSSIFIWNLYKVEISNHSPIYVCAPSMIGCIKRAQSLINSWETKDKHTILQVSYVSQCIN